MHSSLLDTPVTPRQFPGPLPQATQCYRRRRYIDRNTFTLQDLPPTTAQSHLKQNPFLFSLLYPHRAWHLMFPESPSLSQRQIHRLGEERAGGKLRRERRPAPLWLPVSLACGSSHQLPTTSPLPFCPLRTAPQLRTPVKSFTNS